MFVLINIFLIILKLYLYNKVNFIIILNWNINLNIYMELK